MGKRPDISLAMKRSWSRYKNRPTAQTPEDVRWEIARLRFLGYSLREVAKLTAVSKDTAARWSNRANHTRTHIR